VTLIETLNLLRQVATREDFTKVKLPGLPRISWRDYEYPIPYRRRIEISFTWELDALYYYFDEEGEDLGSIEDLPF